MVDVRAERRLAAILAADVVGYSRLMAADEKATHARLKSLRKDFVELTVAEHHGRIVKLMGDGLLAEFASVVDAVECAAAIQKGVSERQTGDPDDQRIAFRIGINLGDVIVEDDDIYGDGVNVAARLEALAEGGGICVSRNVYNQVKNKVDLGFEPMGEHRVKNISEPVVVYRVALTPGAAVLVKAKRAGRATGRHWQVAAAGVAIVVAATLAAWQGGVPYLAEPGGKLIEPKAGVQEAAALPLPDKPSIAVLPFDNLSGDPEQDYFVDGLTEDIITSLARFKDLFVIARHSSFQYKSEAADVREVGRELGVRYVLEGSVQKSDDRLRVTAQLIDAKSGGHVWADRYDRPLVELFKLRDEITREITSTIGTSYGGVVHRAEAIRAGVNAVERLRAYDYVLRSIDYVDQFTEEGLELGKDYLRKAIELDPTYAKAYGKLAIAHYLDYVMGFAEASEALPAIARNARAAIEADPAEPWAWWGLAYYHLFSEGQHEQAIAAIEKALALNPNDADMLAEYGWMLAFAGRADEGIKPVQEAMRLSPHYPEWYLLNLSMIYLVLRDHEKGVAAAAKRTSLSRLERIYLAANLARLGRLDEAGVQVEELLEGDPSLTIGEFMRTHPFKRAEDREYIAESLMLAGLPEAPPAQEARGR